MIGNKATGPVDPVLIELSAKDRLGSYGDGVSKMMSAQCRSSLALNWFTEAADTTSPGREFQSLTIRVLNAFLRTSVLALGFCSFQSWPLVSCESVLHRNVSGVTMQFLHLHLEVHGILRPIRVLLDRITT